MINDLEELIINILVNDQKGEVILPKSKIFMILNMVNKNYNYAKYHMPKLSILTDISEEEINEFYGLSNDSLTNSLETAFKNLRKKSLLIKEEVMTVCVIDSNIQHNESESGVSIKEIVTGKDEYGENTYNYELGNVYKKHRPATSEEKKWILKSEIQALKDMELENKQEAFLSGKWKEYTQKIKEYIFDKYNIIYYYPSYKLTFNFDTISDIYDEINSLSAHECLLKEDNVNENIKILLINNAQKRHVKAKSLISDEGERKKKYTTREQINYLKNNQKLVDMLIDNDQNDIRNKIKSIDLIDKNSK
ncbi:hypothetical protein [Paenibacillus tianjinensis]|uniref:Uncharacterized protein n=1 Tax=Paenibacillus tianjinensis TaxID=2810347 RepID=A0ABX7LAN7_9BACL|nr:hypothetical protein [Paenibacillus tianjinensis]QSF43510.1 hypothetical protein JRJ22_19805 [Paenibacillus tianjinensis]